MTSHQTVCESIQQKLEEQSYIQQLSVTGKRNIVFCKQVKNTILHLKLSNLHICVFAHCLEDTFARRQLRGKSHFLSEILLTVQRNQTVSTNNFIHSSKIFGNAPFKIFNRALQIKITFLLKNSALLKESKHAKGDNINRRNHSCIKTVISQVRSIAENVSLARQIRPSKTHCLNIQCFIILQSNFLLKKFFSKTEENASCSKCKRKLKTTEANEFVNFLTGINLISGMISIKDAKQDEKCIFEGKIVNFQDI